MRRGVFAIGIVLLIIGVVLVALPLLTPTTFNIPASPSALEITPNLVGSGSATISWSGAASTTQITVYSCPGGTCSAAGSTLASVTGASGSVTFSVQAGSTYAVTATGTSAPVAAKMTLSGISPGQLLGVGLLVVGAILALLGYRAQPRAPPAEAAPAAPVETPFSTASPEISGPVVVASTAEETTYPSGPLGASGGSESPTPAASGSRPSRKCGHCGTLNEAWITNCRKCKRPLASTGN